MSCASKKRITNVRINPGCITCGLCEFIAPDVFEVTDVSHVKKNVVFDDHAEAIRDAVEQCPVAVIECETDEKD